MTTANINPRMLTWARERLGLSIPEFARKVSQKEEKLVAWESNNMQPTFLQAIDLAKKAYIPFAYLFLPDPPVEDSFPIADLRTVGSHDLNNDYSITLKDTIKLMQGRQAWYRDYLLYEDAEPVNWVGKYANNLDVTSIANDLRSSLKLNEFGHRGKWDDYYRYLVNRIEDMGILVMRQGYLGHHTRPLNVHEFRGFALVDDLAPLIFINHADAPGPRLFTLIHELTHILIGVTGVSDGSHFTQNNHELICNAVAAEILAPKDEFLGLWNNKLENWQSQLDALAAHFLVSKWVVARRALTFNFIEKSDYQNFVKKEQEEFLRRNKQDGGPNYYLTKRSQISNRFSTAIVGNALNGNTNLIEAANLMGLKVSNLMKMAKELKI